MLEQHERWISSDLKVFEKRDWGWKFIGVAKSIEQVHFLASIDWDHPDDIVYADLKEYR